MRIFLGNLSSIFLLMKPFQCLFDDKPVVILIMLKHKASLQLKCFYIQGGSIIAPYTALFILHSYICLNESPSPQPEPQVIPYSIQYVFHISLSNVIHDSLHISHGLSDYAPSVKHSIMLHSTKHCGPYS